MPDRRTKIRVSGSEKTLVPLMAQAKKEMPMKGEEMQGGGMMMGKMKDMHGKMGEMKKGMSGMMKGQSMMKSEDTKGIR
jgi:hypothetical protein